MVVSVTFPTMMAKMATSAKGWLPLVAMYMVPLMLIGTLRFIFVKEDTNVETEKHEKVNVKAILGMMKKNKYAWMFMAIIFLFNTITSMGTITYYWKYIVGDTSMMGILVRSCSVFHFFSTAMVSGAKQTARGRPVLGGPTYTPLALV